MSRTANPSAIKEMFPFRCRSMVCSSHCASPGDSVTINIDIDDFSTLTKSLDLGLFRVVSEDQSPTLAKSLVYSKHKSVTIVIPDECPLGDYELRLTYGEWILYAVPFEVDDPDAVAQANVFERAQKYREKALLTLGANHHKEAFGLIELASREYKRCSRSDLAARTWYDFGAALIQKGNLIEAEKPLKIALEDFREMGDLKRLVSTLYLLGERLVQENSVEPARKYFEEAGLIGEGIGDEYLVLKSYGTLARVVDSQEYLASFLATALRAKSAGSRSQAISISRSIGYAWTRRSSVPILVHGFQETNKHEWIFPVGAFAATRQLVEHSSIFKHLDIPWSKVLSREKSTLLTETVLSIATAFIRNCRPELKLRVRAQVDRGTESFRVGLAQRVRGAEFDVFLQHWTTHARDFSYFSTLGQLFGFKLKTIRNHEDDDLIEIKVDSRSSW